MKIPREHGMNNFVRTQRCMCAAYDAFIRVLKVHLRRIVFVYIHDDRACLLDSIVKCAIFQVQIYCTSTGCDDDGIYTWKLVTFIFCSHTLINITSRFGYIFYRTRRYVIYDLLGFK